MPEVLIALGSNLGDREGAFQRALTALSGPIQWIRGSRIYETAPMYVLDQPPFLNAAALGRCDMGPFALLDLLKAAEAGIGRKAASRNAPREIDLDLIAYGALQLRSRRGKRTLNLPHAQIRERRFVLAPLFDIDPGLVLPGLGPIAELLQATNSQAEDVKILDDAVLQVCRDR